MHKTPAFRKPQMFLWATYEPFVTTESSTEPCWETSGTQIWRNSDDENLPQSAETQQKSAGNLHCVLKRAHLVFAYKFDAVFGPPCIAKKPDKQLVCAGGGRYTHRVKNIFA